MPKDVASALMERFPVVLELLFSNQMGMTTDEAKKYRLDLMEERSYAKDAVTDILYERPFYLCEH